MRRIKEEELTEVERTFIMIMMGVARDDFNCIRQIIQDHERPVYERAHIKGLLIGLTVGATMGALSAIGIIALTT